ncbi:DUF106 domain-containing protein [Candidatus Woesearchaeota archaeon]|nr:DUF106 domain-containing protein [Candidatus Woesearchaeota archaeon]
MGLLDFLNIILNLPPLAAILVISIAVSVVTTVIYKYTTNQKLMKGIKDEVKSMQAEIRSTKEPGRAAQLQKEMMKKSMQQMNSSWKSMIVTIIPLFLLFGWMQAHLAYSPLMPGEEFTATAYFVPGTEGNITIAATEGTEGLNILTEPVQEIKDGKAIWRLKGENEGAYRLSYSFGDELYAQNVIVTDKFGYESPILAKSKGIKKDSRVERVVIGLKPLQPFGEVALLGWKPGWLATYIIFSIIASMLLRKWLKIY